MTQESIVELVEGALADLNAGDVRGIQHLISATSTDNSISIGNITGSTAVAIGSDIRIAVKQYTLPPETVSALVDLADKFDRKAQDLLRASGHIRVFLSSPSDVIDERQLAMKAIRKLQNDPIFKEKVTLSVVAWDSTDDSTPLLATLTPQSAIDQGLALPSACDIVVVLFWSRMGTPLPLGEYQKPDGSQYLSGTEWEFEEAMAASQATGKPIVIVYRRTQEPQISLGDPAITEKIQQYQRVNAFFEKFTNPDGSSKQGFNTYETPSEFEDLFELHMRKLIIRLLEENTGQPKETPRTHQTGTLVPALDWPRNKSPFPGLRAFGPQDASIFFGRGHETDGLLARLRQPDCRFLAVVGASGSGKSSLVGAGLVPRLRSGAIEGSSDWRVVHFTPDQLGLGEPFASLAAALMRDLPGLSDTRNLAVRLEQYPELLTTLCHDALSQDKEWTKIVIFIDQFEEIFSRTQNEEKRKAFVDSLHYAARSQKLHIVITMRADFYHRCAEVPALAALLKRRDNATFPLSVPDSLSLYEMITRPALVAGLEFEEGLARRIVDDTDDEPGVLPLMAYALQQIWEHQTEQGQLTHRAYDNFGGVHGAIGAQAQVAFNRLSEETQATLPYVFRELVDVDEHGTATRKRALLSNIQKDASTEALVTALTDARLLVQSRDENDRPMVEVAHEAIFRSWPRLSDWITEVHDDLIQLRQVRQAARTWAENHYDKAFLWYDERLRLVYSAIEHLHPSLDDVTIRFIRPEADRLMDEIADIQTSHFRRATIGDRLAEIGDRRAGVGLTEAGIPDIVWCDVPGGDVTLYDYAFMDGEIKGDKASVLATFSVDPFRISKYTVTYRQYRTFLESLDGFANHRRWDGLACHEAQPGVQNRPIDNCPAENVSWYDAVAFTRWLTWRLGYEVRLPTEWEWQYAASGGKPDNLYPWGPEFDLARLNVGDSGLARTTAVGLYPHGASAFGALDMSGNIQEWCLNEFANLHEINMSSDQPRSIRGGSWSYMDKSAEIICRYRLNATTRFGRYGIRLITPVGL